MRDDLGDDLEWLVRTDVAGLADLQQRGVSVPEPALAPALGNIEVPRPRENQGKCCCAGISHELIVAEGKAGTERRPHAVENRCHRRVKRRVRHGFEIDAVHPPGKALAPFADRIASCSHVAKLRLTTGSCRRLGVPWVSRAAHLRNLRTRAGSSCARAPKTSSGAVASVGRILPHRVAKLTEHVTWRFIVLSGTVFLHPSGPGRRRPSGRCNRSQSTRSSWSMPTAPLRCCTAWVSRSTRTEIRPAAECCPPSASAPAARCWRGSRALTSS